MTPISKKDLEKLAEVDVLSKGAPSEPDKEMKRKSKHYKMVVLFQSNLPLKN